MIDIGFMCAWFEVSKSIDQLSEDLRLMPERRHQDWLKSFNTRCDLIQAKVVHEIQMKFKEAFPRRAYVFLLKRQRDKQPWPVVFLDKERANNCEDRVGPVIEVLL